tara:strand:+ start:2776 stop:3582 length:807 start_codon:yes stop_codon:yes gene_type:complete
MEIFIVQDGDKRGPFTRYRVREMLRAAEVSGDTMGWVKGEDAWKPLRDIPAALTLIQEVEREKLDAKLAAETDVPTLPPEPTVPPGSLATHAMSRFGARMFDLMLFQTIVLYLFAPDPVAISDMDQLMRILKGDQTEEEAAYFRELQKIGLASIFAWHLIEWIFLACFGATLGKYLFNLRVQGPDGEKPKAATCLYRSILVWMLGMAAGLPVFQFVANFLAFLRVQNRGVATWDTMLHTQVIQRRMTLVRAMVIFGIFGLLMIASQTF